MPNNGDTSNYTSVFRLTPLGDPHRKVIKRNRQVVSCIPCRTRKLKCDRQQPCTSCVKRSDAVSCRFFGASGAGGSSGQTPPVPRKQVQVRLQQLEDLVNGMVNQSGSDAPAAKDASEAAHSAEQPRPARSASSRDEAVSPGRPDGNNVRYAGGTSYAAVLECIHNLQELIDEEAPDYLSAGSHLSRPGSQHEAQEAQERHAPASAHPRRAATPLTAQQIIDCLPPRSECDKALTFYFQQVYLIPMAIHSGQFQRAYEAFWKEPNNASLLWISTLFSVLSTAVFQQASKAAESEGLGAAGIQDEAAKEKIDLYSSMAYRCLDAGDYLLGKPHSVEAALLFVLHLVLQKRDTDPICWHTCCTAIRLAQKMGYHRDATYLNRSTNMKISAFDAEMRRRTWYTLEHLDISFGFLLGIPPMINGADVDTKLPSNLHDEEFGEHSQSLPPSRPYSDFTPVLFYIYSARQVQVLRGIVRQAVAVAQPSYGDVLSFDDDLRSLHEHVPPNLRYRPIRQSSFADVPDIIVRRMVLEIIHLKGVCVLHRRYLTTGRENTVYDRSREACRDAALKLLDLHAEFDEQSGDGGRLYEKRFLVTNAGFHVFLLAAMCLCLDLSSGNRKQPFHDRAVSALKRAGAIWSRTASVSKESAHATKVLEAILTKVSSSTQASTPKPPDDRRSPATAPNSSSAPSDQPEAAASSWSAVNNKAPQSSRAVRRDFSVAWDFGVDAVRTERNRDSDDPIDLAVNGDMDWNEIDSYLLDRGHVKETPATTSPASPPTNDNPREGWAYIERGGRKARENWSYPQYDHNDGSPAASTTNFRTWARGGTTLGGFGFP
ncbi:hypothetical protein KVR01_001789 [Diaporthe batatas]|uniref:uncharacterized protein n=1 Tax=Diaporthe batatas TaxID=748121 RepID=UPI001D05934A|nr:uncharacterized protein KVR01_001789 [Diaporthe batatas]KAG8169040.1 hypothetical protein KVR01_001789 [Diaporthe batatas]